MLFTAPLFKILTKEEKETGLRIRGYVDDSLLTYRAKDETLTTPKGQAAFYKIETWAKENGMIFDPRKFEAIHFSWRTAFPNPEIKLPLPSSANGLGVLRVIKHIPKKRL